MWAGGHVDETKTAMKERLDTNEVAKSGDNRRVRASGEGVRDPEGRAEHPNEVLNNDSLGVKAPKQFVVRQPRKGVREAGGGGAEPEVKVRPTEDGAEA